jgi:hypothetical protein
MENYIQEFMKGVVPPKRPMTFRLKVWVYARIFMLGEWAGQQIAHHLGLSPLEQMYVACDVAGTSPEHLRAKYEVINNAVFEELAKNAAKKANVDGIVQ